jgi:SPP1 gp7 family putative phage head morphogenesis protein
MSDFKLAPEKKKWVGMRTTTLLGNRLNYNASQQQRYYSELRGLITQLADATEKALIQFFKGSIAKEYYSGLKEALDDSISSKAQKLMNQLADKFNDLFATKSEPIVEKMVNGAHQTSKTSIAASLATLSGGLTINTDRMSSDLKEIISSVTKENVKLIKSISSDYLNQVQGAVMRSIISGQGLKDLIPFLQRYKGITYRRARMIAHDQTRKAYSFMNKEQMIRNGVKKFKWLHSGGARQPRPDHIAMSGNIYSFDNLPVIDKRTGERGIPGQAINCGCTMTPIIEFDEGEELNAA